MRIYNIKKESYYEAIIKIYVPEKTIFEIVEKNKIISNKDILHTIEDVLVENNISSTTYFEKDMLYVTEDDIMLYSCGDCINVGKKKMSYTAEEELPF